MAKQTDIQVLMVGGKRCGKTTILADMMEGSVDALEGKLKISPVNDGQHTKLWSSYCVATDYFDEDIHPKGAILFTDENKNFDRQDYSFSVGIPGVEDSNLHVTFVDVPGEWFDPLSENHEDAERLLKESNVLIIAVDTPCLMDETVKGRGVLHVEYNKSESITNGITKGINDLKGDISNRLVLFVPIKCEDYYNQNKMSDVTEMVKEGYCKLIDYFKSSDLENSTTVAIMPILSMGGMEFVAFKHDPEKGRYMEGFQITGSFKPQFCEQPLFSAMMLLLLEATNKIKPSNWFTKWLAKRKQKNGKFTADVAQDMFNVIKPLLRGNDSQNGFEVIQDPLNIFM